MSRYPANGTQGDAPRECKGTAIGEIVAKNMVSSV